MDVERKSKNCICVTQTASLCVPRTASPWLLRTYGLAVHRTHGLTVRVTIQPDNLICQQIPFL